MNTVFTIIKNSDFIKDHKYKLFIESLKNLDMGNPQLLDRNPESASDSI